MVANSLENTSTLIIPQLIVGLGNPEPKYDRTRHNVGFAAIDTLAQTWSVSLSEQRKFKGIFGEGRGPHGQPLRLLKPLTYMNRSGESIRAVIDWYKWSPQSVLVIYDDLDLPVGRLRLRLSGSAGGHNGIKSTISHLGTQTFPRLRVGISKPSKFKSAEESETVSYVLGKFSPSESETMTEVLKLVVEALEVGLRDGIEKAMSLYNGRSIPEKIG